MTSSIKSINVYPTTDKTLPTFDNTKLVALNTCPTWGVIRYSHHKTFSSGGRAMALEAGGAAHEVFAAHRLWHIKQHGVSGYGFDQAKADSIFDAHGRRLFGDERFDEMVAAVDENEDQRQQMMSFSLTALYNSGFYDSPEDKRRTTTNIEEMCIAYMDTYDWRKQLPIIRNDGAFVGIEVPVDVTVEFTMADGEIKSYRFIGKADGIHYKDEAQQDIRVHENKTASRLDDAWSMSWETNHQPTGYMIALSSMLDVSIRDGLILGSALPLPKSYTINGMQRVPVTRHDFQIREWFEWFLHTVDMHDRYVDQPLNAPQYTHSCNRFFRPCSMIPVCASDPEERQDMFDEMAVEEWSPLEEGSGD